MKNMPGFIYFIVAMLAIAIVVGICWLINKYFLYVSMGVLILAVVAFLVHAYRVLVVIGQLIVQLFIIIGIFKKLKKDE